jgi:hypothetical protein
MALRASFSLLAVLTHSMSMSAMVRPMPADCDVSLPLTFLAEVAKDAHALSRPRPILLPGEGQRERTSSPSPKRVSFLVNNDSEAAAKRLDSGVPRIVSL